MDGLGSAEEQAEAKAFVTQQAFADRCWQTAPVLPQRLHRSLRGSPLFSS